MKWGLRGKAQRTLERTVGAMVPGSERVFSAFHAIRGHREHVGIYPNLLRPKTFNEKVLHRRVFDRRPILTTLQDKYAARHYVRDKIGEHVLPRLYWVTKTPADIPFDDLPDKFVVKPTHGCEWFYLVPDKARLDQRDLVTKSSAWLRQSYYWGGCREWAYKHIEPRIIVEEFLDDGTGPDPIRYKMYTFHGSARVISVGVGTHDEVRCNFYDSSWNKLPATIAHLRPPERKIVRPRHLDDMIRYSEVLGDGLDFIRVDWYDMPDRVYFGEFAVYPSAGVNPYTPHEFDYFLGGLWRPVTKVPSSAPLWRGDSNSEGPKLVRR